MSSPLSPVGQRDNAMYEYLGEEVEHPFGIFTRRGRRSSPEYIEWAASDTEGGARLAVETLTADAKEAEKDPPTFGILDRTTGKWLLWPWGCPGCGSAAVTRPELCGFCRRDQDLGERLGTSRAEEEEPDPERFHGYEGEGERP